MQEAAGQAAPALEIATFDEFKQIERGGLKSKDKHKSRDGGNGERPATDAWRLPGGTVAAHACARSPG